MSGYPGGGYPGQQPPTNPYGGYAPPAAGRGYPGAGQPSSYGAPQAQNPYGGAPYRAAPAPPQSYGAAQPGYAPQAPPGVSPEIMSWFRAVDQDNSGFINASELSRALQSGNNRNFSQQACQYMIAMFDKSNSGRIDLHQFSQLFTFINQWTDAFRRADDDNSGSIAVNEMQRVLSQQGYNIGPQTIDLMVRKFGNTSTTAYGPASLGLDGFIMVNVQLQRLTNSFRQRDTQQKGVITIGYEDFIAMVIGSL